MASFNKIIGDDKYTANLAYRRVHEENITDNRCPRTQYTLRHKPIEHSLDYPTKLLYVRTLGISKSKHIYSETSILQSPMDAKSGAANINSEYIRM